MDSWSEGAFLKSRLDVKHRHARYVQDLVWSSRPKTSNCEGGSDLGCGGDTAETLIRLDQPIILPAILEEVLHFT